MSKKDYIEAINEINADENLKNNTLQKMKDAKKKKKSIGMGCVARTCVCDLQHVGVRGDRESGRGSICYDNFGWKIRICGRYGTWRV